LCDCWLKSAADHNGHAKRADADELVAEIYDRMPLILAPADYVRWLSDEPDPRDLMRPFPAEPMRMWPISTRVNKPENDEPSILDPITTLVA
jgi:putative SOS response-associated peptidase YedK